MSIMADDSWLLREDGYLYIDTKTFKIICHPNLNVILLSSESGVVHVLDVNSGVILQSSSLSGINNAPVGIQYLPGSDRIVFWDSVGLGVRSDYNGVLLLHTVLQQPLQPNNPNQIVKVELFLSEAVLLYQCLQSIELVSVECAAEVVKALGDAIEKANELPKKGIKAQKWSTICLELPHLSLKLVASNIVSELKQHSRHVPALAIASALNQRISDLMPSTISGSAQDVHDRGLMFSEAARRETFKRWPHMDYKWALPSQMAQAGFYHQPTSSGDDRAMCFTCFVCLVSWERTDEPWSEHERHSPNCPLVKGEYTHNVPLSVTYATSPAYSHPNISMVSRGNSGDIFVTGTSDGKVSIWNIDCKLKLQQEFSLSLSDPILHNKVYGPYSNIRKAWNESPGKDHDRELSLTSLSVVGRCQNKDRPCSKSSSTASVGQAVVADGQCKARPSIVCGFRIGSSEAGSDIWGDGVEPTEPMTVRAVVHSSEAVKAMNDQNQAKTDGGNNDSGGSYLMVYDFQGKCAQTVSPLTNGNGNAGLKNGGGKSGGSKKCAGVANPGGRTDDANIFDDIYLSKYMCLDDEPELSPDVAFVTGINDQVTVIDLKSLVGSSGKEQEIGFSQKIDYTADSGTKVSGTDGGSVSIDGAPVVSAPKHIWKCNPQLDGPYCVESDGKSPSAYKSFDQNGVIQQKPTFGTFSSTQPDIKISDEVDAVLDDYSFQNHLPFLGISELLLEYKDSGIKMKVPYGKPPAAKVTGVKSSQGSEAADSEPLIPEEILPPACVAVQCVPLPASVCGRGDVTITHILPTNDGDRLLVVLSGDTDGQSYSARRMNDGFDEDIETENSSPSYLVMYALKYDSAVTTIDESPLIVKEIPSGETPVEVCLLPNLEGSGGTGLAATVGRDGALRLLDLSTLRPVAEAKLEVSGFVSVAFCAGLEKLCATTDMGSVYFYAVRDGEGDSDEDTDEEEARVAAPEAKEKLTVHDESEAGSTTDRSTLIAHKPVLSEEDLANLASLAGVGGKGDGVVAYSAVVPGCWCELLPAQRPRGDHQNLNRTWRLQNTASTWDEHVLELTLPWSLSIAHVELRFTLHSPCPTPPNIQVTLLKQRPRGIGRRRESADGFCQADDRIDFNLIDPEPKGPVENPVRSAEYLRAHNAEILAGPMPLSQGLDLTRQAGALTLTSPRLFRARGRTLLLHVKTLFDPSRESAQGKVSSSKRSKSSDGPDPLFNLPGSTVERFAMPLASKKVEFYIGCDWLHEISVTVRGNKRTEVPQERLQRIAMLESDFFLKNLVNLASSDPDSKRRAAALDLLIWIVSIRLARFRNARSDSTVENGDLDLLDDDSFSSDKPKHSCPFKTDSESQQVECAKIIQQNILPLVKTCLFYSKRSIAKKCIKLILICSEGVRNIEEDISHQFEMAILESVTACLPLIGAVKSAGSLRWFAQLAMRAVPLDADMKCATICMQLLKEIASIMQAHSNPYHLLLRSRFGLYGLPMESTIFDVEPPVLGKTSSIPLTYASIVAGDGGSNHTSHQEIDLRDLYNYAGKSSSGWWSNESCGCNSVAGLGEVMALRVVCHSASDGTHLDTVPTHQAYQTVNTISADQSQFWDMVGPKECPEHIRALTETDTMKNMVSEMNQNENDAVCFLMECDTAWPLPDDAKKTEEGEGVPLPESPFHYKDGTKFSNGTGSIPWQQLVQQPPQQILVIKRMHSGARHFVVLDFGHPVKLTDLIIPACPELVTLSIDIWLVGEDQDSTRLILAPDISVKNLIMTDIQPPPLCKYLKITTIGRYNMSTTRCKIPLGWFYGEVADSAFAYEQPHVNTLTALHQDLTCRFRLAVGKLTDSLDSYLDMSGGNAAHMTAYLDQQNDTDPRVRSAYQECLELQQQMNTVETIMERFKSTKRKNFDDTEMYDETHKQTSSELLKFASTDKLRTIAEQLTDILLFICFECFDASLKRPTVSMSMSSCVLITRWLVVCGGGPRLQAGLASVLARLCSPQPWWGAFMADTLAQLYSPANTLIFPQDRVLILLVYMGRKSLSLGGSSGAGGVVECVSQLVARLLPPPTPAPPDSPRTQSGNSEPVWQTTDLALLGWLLVYLSACLDTAQPKHSSPAAWSRWDFLSGGSCGTGGNNASGGSSGTNRSTGGPCGTSRFHRRKLQKRPFQHRLEELEAVRKAFQVQALSVLSSQAALSQQHSTNVSQHHLKAQENIFKTTLKQHWVKRFEDFIQNRISILNKKVAGCGASSSSRQGTSAEGGGNSWGNNGSLDSESQPAVDTRSAHLISQPLALQVSRGLISLILSMDFTCNIDLLLLACKVVGRLSGVCGGLSNVVREHEVLGLMKAACSPAPWHQHTLVTLLQDLVEYDRAGTRGPAAVPMTAMPIIQTETADGSLQWQPNQNFAMCSFPQSEGGTDDMSELISATTALVKLEGNAASPSVVYEIPPSMIYESDDSDMEEFLDEISERGRSLFKKATTPKPPVSTSNGASIAVDARLESGIEMSGEVLVRRLALVGSGALAAAVHSTPPATFSPIPAASSSSASASASASATPTHSQSQPQPNDTPSTSTDRMHTQTNAPGDLNNMLAQSFHLLFTQLETQDDSNYLERVLQLWITLNGCSWGASINNTTPPDTLLTPKIKLSPQAVLSLIHALNQQNSISLRCWVLAFQCLSWVAYTPSSSPTREYPEGLAGIMIEDSQFGKMLVKFLSSNLASDLSLHGGDKSSVGPVACATMSCLLQRVAARTGVAARGVMLGALRRLAGPGGALRGGRGAPDAQRELLRAAALNPTKYTPQHLPEAMSLIESIGIIVQSACSSFGVEAFGIGESSNIIAVDANSGGSSGGVALGGLLAEVLGGVSDSARRERPANRRDLIISLLAFARALVMVPLQAEGLQETVTPPEESNEESQTDESKVSQQQTTSDNAASSSSPNNSAKVPCLADTVLQHYPTMKRIFKTLASCWTTYISHTLDNNIAVSLDSINSENICVGDALFKFVMTLAETATHPKLTLTPLLDFLDNLRGGTQGGLSEALVSFTLRSLESPLALETFVSLGGVEVVCARLVASHRSQLSPRPGLVAALMNHLRQPTQPVSLAAVNPTNPEKAQQTNMEISEGLLNFAPLGSISSSSPSTAAADALLGSVGGGAGGGAGVSGSGVAAGGGGGGGAHHRRTRSAAWSHHFCRGETSVDLAVRLPHAVLLHEVQLQPHLTTLSTCPSAVSLEICAQGCVMTPLGPPQPTAGMTYIRLKLAHPQVVNTVLIRLYKPRDSSNMGLLNLRILGTAAFASPASPEKLDEKLASTSVGWTRVLSCCVCGTSAAHREARGRASKAVGLAEASAGLLLAAAASPPLLKPLLLALGGEAPTALRVLSLLLKNAHVPAHHGYQYSSMLSNNTNSAIDSVCDLLYQLCTVRDEHSPQRIKTYIDWLKDCGESAVAHSHLRSRGSELLSGFSYDTKYLSSVYIQCLASVLWSSNQRGVQYNLKELITQELFEILYNWIALLPKDAAIKKALDSVLCSICYIRPELFTLMLEKMGVLVPETSIINTSSMNAEASISDDRKDLEVMISMTDDTKVNRGTTTTQTVLKPASLEKLNLSPSQLMTIAAACMSPEAAKALMKSHLPLNVADAIKRFCTQQCQLDKGSSSSESSLTDSDKASTRDGFTGNTYQNSDIGGLVSIEMMPVLVEWLSCLCMDGEIKNWLGGISGSCFWNPLLLMLCLPQSNARIWHRNEYYTQLEEKTIRLFGALMTCHPSNQQLFATTLYHVISSHPDTTPGIGSPIGGFTRGLLLRLLLRSERVSIAVRGKSDSANRSWGGIHPAGGASPPPRPLVTHPSLYGCALLSLPHHTLLSDVVKHHLIFSGQGWLVIESAIINLSKKSGTVGSGSTETGGNSQQGTAGSGAVDAWELSVAAANTAKDKRAKDARNLSAKQALFQGKKKGTGSQGTSSSAKKDDNSNSSNSPSNVGNTLDSLALNSVKICVEGLDGPIPLNTSLGLLCAATTHRFGPSLNITISPPSNTGEQIENRQEAWSCPWRAQPSLLSVFAGAGGLALLAHHLPPVCPAPSLPPQPAKDSGNAETDWVKLDDIYEDVGEASSNSTSDEASNSVPTHSLVALGLLLRLPGYAEALLKEGQRAVHLLRLLLGVTDDGEGKDIMSVCGPGLGTLAFRVLGALLESSPLSTDDGLLLRGTLLRTGTLRLLLVCLAVFTHQQPESPPSEANNSNGNSSKTKAEEKSKLYWAKGTGFGTGSTQQSWNVEQSLMRQKTEEEHVTVLLQVIASYIQPGERWGSGERRPSADGEPDGGETSSSSASSVQQPCLPPEFTDMLHRSALLPAISSYLRNDSVLDMSRHIPLYLAVMRVVRAVMTTGGLCLNASHATPFPPSLAVIPPLLHQMSRTVDTYATKLKMNKKTIYGKTTYSHRFGMTNTDGGEDDEGLALLIPDIQATSALVQSRLGLGEDGAGLGLGAGGTVAGMPRTLSAATREARYLEVMRRLQFETFEMIAECPDNGYKFNVAYHFESTVRAAGERCHPARMKRLAQEAVTLSTSLPLSYSSSVFVRTDQDRLDVMKVLITGPSDTPYANGCFELDVYFPVDYPNTPMLINLETTGRHSVRFNPNLYLDGKVCLSVLNTWHGRPEEQWNAQTSSFLQVLVSIQSLILVPEPYFNEPGFERSRGTPGGTHHSLEYNSNIYQACVRWAMLEQLRNPTSCFQQVIRTHFWLKRDEICSVIESWIAELEMQSGDKRTQRNICLNTISLKRHYNSLREELAKLTVPPGLEDLATPFSAARESPVSPAVLSVDQHALHMEQDMEKLVSEVCE